MGLHDVERSIRQDAEAAAERKLAEARLEAERIVSSAKAQIVTERARFDEQTKELLDAVERKELGHASAHAKSIILEAQRHALTSTMEHARGQLLEMPADEREALLKSLVARAQRELPDLALIRCNPQDKAVLAKLAPQTTIHTDDHIVGGLIAEDEAGEVRSELTYETLLAAVRERETPTIARILFPGRVGKSMNRLVQP